MKTGQLEFSDSNQTGVLDIFWQEMNIPRQWINRGIPVTSGFQRVKSYLEIIDGNTKISKMKINALLSKEKKCFQICFIQSTVEPLTSIRWPLYSRSFVVLPVFTYRNSFIHMNVHLSFYYYTLGNILLPQLKYWLCSFFLGYSLRWPTKKLFCLIMSAQLIVTLTNIWISVHAFESMTDLLKMLHFVNYFMVLMSDTLKYYHFPFYIIFSLFRSWLLF